MVQGRGDEGTPAGDTLAAEPREIASDRLFQGGREIVITHAGERYRLRITRQNKLILNK